MNCRCISISAGLEQRPAIQVGGVSEGEIPGFGSRYVELVFSPEEAKEHTEEFLLIFSHPHLQPVSQCQADVKHKQINDYCSTKMSSCTRHYLLCFSTHTHTVCMGNRMLITQEELVQCHYSCMHLK